MKTHYAEYVGHAARLYFKFPKGTTNAEILNWNAINTIYMGLPERDQGIIKDFYTTGYTHEWTVVKKFEKAVAKERCLI